jgi:broad specificity phosphatase PhoE
MKYSCLLTLSLGFLIALLLSLPALAEGPRQIFLSRHMEKAISGKDPALSPCGEAQAQVFAAQLKDTPLAWLMHTPYLRTKQTAQAFLQPGRQLLSYDPRQVDLLITQLNSTQGNVLVIGHSNTIPALVAKLTGESVVPLSEQDYGRIYTLTQQDGKQWQLKISQLPKPPACRPNANAI